MTKEQFDKCTIELDVLANAIASAKRPAYTVGSEDVLSNFKRSAERYGTTPLQAWGILFDKHIQALGAYAKNPTAPQAEPIDGRFADALNYIQLGFALVTETKPPSK